jgi:hypothetical protein
MTKAFDYIPGVPAAGHVTGGGYWHPGRSDNCVKCEPPRPRVCSCGHAGTWHAVTGREICTVRTCGCTHLAEERKR